MVRFEMLVSRSVSRRVSQELDLAGVKMPVEEVLRVTILGFFALFLLTTIILVLATKIYDPLAGVAGLFAGALYIASVYLILEYKIEGRKTRLENMLPDYFQITSANLRSGIALDRAMLLAARPEFGFLSDDIKDMNRRIYSGENFENALRELATRYRSFELTHSVRMMLESLRYGGAMADLFEQMSKGLRSQQLVQKEIAGQLFMYSIFIAFAGLIAAPVLYGLTSQMIVVTDTIWKGILSANPGGIPTIGVSFLKPTPPKISADVYYDFSFISILIITGFASLIMSAVSTGSALKGLRYMPIFIIVGLAIFFVMQHVIAGMFSSIGAGI